MTYFLGLAEPLLKLIDACKDKGLNLSPEASSFRALVKMRMTHGSFELGVMPEEKDGLDKLENDRMEEVSRRVKEQKVDLDKEQEEKDNTRYLELKKIHKENREIRKIIREREKINAYKSKNPFFRCLSWLGILGPDGNKIKIGRSEETYYKVFNALETERAEKLRLATIASKREVLLKAVEEEKAHRRAEYLEHVATVEQALARAEEKINSQEALIKNQDNNLKNVLEESKHYKSLSEQKSLRMNELEKIAREERERDALAVERVQKAQEETKEAVERSIKWEGIVKKKQHEIDMLLDSSQKASSALKVATERAEKAEEAAQLRQKLLEQESFDRKKEGERAQSEIKALLEKVQKAQATAPAPLENEIPPALLSPEPALSSSEGLGQVLALFGEQDDVLSVTTPKTVALPIVNKEDEACLVGYDAVAKAEEMIAKAGLSDYKIYCKVKLSTSQRDQLLVTAADRREHICRLFLANVEKGCAAMGSEELIACMKITEIAEIFPSSARAQVEKDIDLCFNTSIGILDTEFNMLNSARSLRKDRDYSADKKILSKLIKEIRYGTSSNCEEKIYLIWDAFDVTTKYLEKIGKKSDTAFWARREDVLSDVAKSIGVFVICEKYLEAKRL